MFEEARVSRIWPIFGSVFALKLRFFGFGVLPGLRIFSNLVIGFRFLSTMMAVFWIFQPNAFYDFSGFVKEVAVTLKLLFQETPYIAFYPFF